MYLFKWIVRKTHAEETEEISQNQIYGKCSDKAKNVIILKINLNGEKNVLLYSALTITLINRDMYF